MRRFRRFLDWTTAAAGALAAVSLITIGLVVLAQIVGRNLGFLVRGADEIAVYSLSTLSFFGLAYTLRDHGHIRVDTFLGLIPQSARAPVYRLTALFAGLFTAYLTYHAGWQLYFSVIFNERSQGLLGFPIWIPQIAMVAGLALFALRFLGETMMPPPALEADEIEAEVKRAAEEG